MGRPKGLIQRAAAQQFFLCATVCNAPFLQHHDLVRVLDGGEPVGDDQKRFPPGKRHNGALDFVLILGISEGGRLVQNHNGGVLQNGAGDGDALTLPAGELLARVSGRRIPAMLQPADKFFALGRLSSRQHLLVRGPRTPQPDVLFQGAVKEEVVLRDETDGLGELLQRELADVLSHPKTGRSAGRW